jgi:exodeoxyribonuclease-3
MVSESLQEKLKAASILADVVHSDHCPIVVEMEF